MKSLHFPPAYVPIGRLAVFLIVFLTMGSLNALAEVRQVQSGESVQRAISEAKSGDIINIMPGVYKEKLTVDKRLTIKGEEGVIIDGGGSGSVITLSTDNIVVEGLTIRNSGMKQDDSGIYINKANEIIVKRNVLENVHYGIFIANSKRNQIIENQITSYQSHFSKRGNGIHLFKGESNLVKGNEITKVQDGIYFDFTKKVNVTENHISDSRYAMHLMFSEEISAERNNIEKNITGFMVMDSSDIKIHSNRVADHFHVRGFGVLIYESNGIEIAENEIVRNSTGLSMEKGTQTIARKNLIAANQVGLEFKRGDEQNTFTENNFIGNVVQSKISDGDMRLDNGEKGNYWDDYNSFDLTGDGIGEEAYKAGSLYDNLLQTQPYWQFYFESPSVKLWIKAESLFPSMGAVNVYDSKPLIEPVSLLKQIDQKRKKSFLSAITGTAFIILSLLIIMKGRKRL